MWLFFLSPWTILILVLCIIACGVLFLQNIGYMILIAIFVIVMLVLLVMWPKQTIITTVLLAALGSGYYYIDSTVKTNNTPVTIYQATDICTFFDEQNTRIQIPNGAIVAKFYHPKQESIEKQVHGSSYMCYWYYDGTVFYSTESLLHSKNNKFINNEKNEWHLEEIKKTTLKQFQKGNWWTTATQ